MLDYSLTQCLLLTLNKLLFVQTIAIIPVLPRGVLQLGSTNVVRYPGFGKWDYNILEVVLCHYNMGHDVFLYDYETIYIVDRSNVLFSWYLYKLYCGEIWGRQNLVDGSGNLKIRATCDDSALFLAIQITVKEIRKKILRTIKGNFIIILLWFLIM